MEPLKIKAGNPDVSRIMARIRQLISDTGSTGLSADREEELIRQRLSVLAYEAMLPPEVLEQIVAGGGRWNVVGDFPIKSHRGGVAGRMVVHLKRLFRPLVRALISPLIYRQAELNRYYRSVASHLLEETVRLRAELDGVRRMVQEKTGDGAVTRREEALERIAELIVVEGGGPEDPSGTRRRRSSRGRNPRGGPMEARTPEASGTGKRRRDGERGAVDRRDGRSERRKRRRP